MRFYSLCAIVLFTSLAALPCTTSAQGGPPRCFELRLGAWAPPLALGEDSVYIQPPLRVRFDTTVGSGPLGRGRRILRPEAGAARSVHRSGYWTLADSGQLQLVWTTGFSGLTMRLGATNGRHAAATSDTLRGTAETFWDFARPRQTAPVVAIPIACGPVRAPTPGT